ncbi:MAG: FGGY family carbohydrate kinase [Candidatus Brocadiia bacterium]|nr:FGGY family carbohydrate kinase [Candidatus Brocadiia bacterium]
MIQAHLAIGVDVGTTGCRACVLSAAGEAVATAAVPYEPDRPRPGWAEQDPEVWWRAFCDAARQVTAGGAAKRLAAVAVSAQSTALVPVDEAGRPVRRAIIWQDTRSAAECAEIAERFGAERVRDIIGWPPATFLVWPKVLWLARHEPAVLRRSRWLLQAGNFITHRLCGRMVLDRANAVGYPMDLEALAWSSELTARRSFPTGKVPPVAPSTAVVGRVSADAAAHCGLPEGLPVVAGGMDTACAALAVGAFRPGRAFEVSGTSGGIGIISERPSTDRALGVAPHLLEGLYINHAPMSAAGASLAWCRDVLCASESRPVGGERVDPFELMEREVAGLTDGPTGLLFLPYMAGERAPVWDAQARGAIVGLTLATSRPQVIKAVMEGVGYALRQNIDIAEAGGLNVADLRSCGGGSRSEAWCRIKADITARRFIVYPPERDAAFGAALLAGVGAELWSLDEGDAALERCRPRVYSPRPEVAARYARYQRAYDGLYSHLRSLLPAAPDTD